MLFNVIFFLVLVPTSSIDQETHSAAYGNHRDFPHKANSSIKKKKKVTKGLTEFSGSWIKSDSLGSSSDSANNQIIMKSI